MRSLELGHGHVAQGAWMEKSRRRRRLKWKILKRRKKKKKLSEKWFEFYTSKVYDVWQPATILFIAHTRTHSHSFNWNPHSHEEICVGPYRTHTAYYDWMYVATTIVAGAAGRRIRLSENAKNFSDVFYSKPSTLRFSWYFCCSSDNVFLFVYTLYLSVYTYMHLNLCDPRFKPLNFMEWTALLHERFPAPNGNRFTFRQLF